MKTGEKIRLLSEYTLIVMLALGIIEIFLLGIAAGAADAAPEIEPAHAQQMQQMQQETQRELPYDLVLLAAETPVNDLAEDPLRGFDGVLEACTVTYYCTEQYPHICGGGTGKTASGTTVTAGRSAAVDPAVIPLGADVWVDYGDGALHHYIAEDAGGAVNGAHIDLAVESHAQALELGVQAAKVWWSK